MRCKCVSSLVDEHPHALSIICLPRHQNFQVIAKTNQASVEHPMYGPGKSHTVVNDDRPPRLDGSGVGGFNLRVASAVDQFNTTNRASLAIGPQDGTAEHPITQFSRLEIGHAVLFTFILEGGLLFTQPPCPGL